MQLIVSRALRQTRRHRSGFSLIELAVALAIIAVVLGAVLVPLTTQISLRNETATQKLLEQISEALLGYAAAAGRLPCPATENSDGAEDFAAGGDATNGICQSSWGFVPAVTLGLSSVDGRGFAVDAWGTTQNRIRYAVASDTLNGVQNPFTRAGGMRTATMAWLVSAELLHVCASSADVLAGTHCTTTLPYDATNTLTNNAPAVIWSVGPNAGTTGGNSNDERQNPNPNTINPSSADRIFVSHVRSGAPEFDDIVTWLSAPRLINRMIVAGQLP